MSCLCRKRLALDRVARRGRRAINLGPLGRGLQKRRALRGPLVSAQERRERQSSGSTGKTPSGRVPAAGVFGFRRTHDGRGVLERISDRGRGSRRVRKRFLGHRPRLDPAREGGLGVRWQSLLRRFGSKVITKRVENFLVPMLSVPLKERCKTGGIERSDTR